MATTDFKYCSVKEVLEVCPELSNFNTKRVVRGWKEQTTGSNYSNGTTADAAVSTFYVNDLPVSSDEVVFVNGTPLPDVTYGNVTSGIYPYSHDITKVVTSFDGMFNIGEYTQDVNELTTDAQNTDCDYSWIKASNEWFFINR